MNISFKSIVLLTVTIITLSVISNAETKPWEISVDANVTLTWNSYSNSWTGEEEGALSWSSQLLLQTHKQLIKQLRTENTLRLQFGQTKIEDQKVKVSSDLIDFETIKKFTFGIFANPFIAGRLQTTFLDAEPTGNHEVKYVNPLVFSESFGLSRTFIKQDNQSFSSRLGGAFYQRINRKIDTKNDGGIELVTKYNVNTKDNFLSYDLFLNLYQAVYSSDSDNSDKWKAIDIDWQNTFAVNLTKYIMVNFMFQLLYDRDILEDVRTKQILSVGLTYKFKNTTK